MTTDTVAPATSSPTLLLTATRWLAGLHALGGLGLLGLAGYLVLAYQDAADTDSLAGLALIFAAGYVVLGLVLLVLGGVAVLSRSAGAVLACGLSAGLFSLGVFGVSGYLMFFFPVVAVAALTASAALVVCALIGLTRR